MTYDATGMDSTHDEEQDSFDGLLHEVAQLRVPGFEPVRLPQVGEVVGEKYRVEELIGAGGMGAVYRATHVTTGKEVALKWLLSSGAAARFLREARAMARVEHPNVVDVYDVGAHGGAPYLVMELLRGISLRTRLRAGRLSPSELASIMIPALRGVSAAHARGVIHRDLKPDNIFLCRPANGAPPESKVLDFGISKLRAKDDGAATLTKDGASLGTPAYMSPEQLEDPLRVDERTDVYAAGIIMYEALTGCVPFCAENPAALVLSIVRQKAAPVRGIVPSVPARFERIVMRAMAKRAEDRYCNMDALVEALLPWSEVREGGGQPIRPLRGFPRESWTWTGLPLGILAAFGIGWHLQNLLDTASPSTASATALEVSHRATEPRTDLARVRAAPAHARLCEPASGAGTYASLVEPRHVGAPSCSMADVNLTLQGDIRAHAPDAVRSELPAERVGFAKPVRPDKRDARPRPPAPRSALEITFHPHAMRVPEPRVAARAGAIYLSDL